MILKRKSVFEDLKIEKNAFIISFNSEIVSYLISNSNSASPQL